MNKFLKFLAILTFTGWAGTSYAVPMGFNFSYDFLTTDDVITGMLLGELQSDNNTVLVESVSMVALNDVPFVRPLLVPASLNMVTLDGTEFNFCPSFEASCRIEGFAIDREGPTNGLVIVGAHELLGEFGETPFNTAGWLLTPKADVPAPATLALFGLGLAGLGWSRRKQHS